MKHIEASKKIIIAGDTEVSQVKYSLMQRMRGAFNVETVGEGTESFSVTAIGKTGAYGFTLGIALKSDRGRIRILVDGQNALRFGTKIFYVTSLLLILLLSIFQDSLSNAPSNNIAMNAMFFLVIGGFIIFDHSKKMDEPQIIIEQILNSVEAEFG
jgi:hypothetical protein